MALHPPTSKRESVLVYGDNGSGKSSVIVSLADWIKRTKSDATVWLLDTNRGWEAGRVEDGSLDEIVRVEYLNVQEFGTWVDVVNRVRGKVKDNDWLIVDQQTDAWEGAQRWYWGKKSGNDSLAELWLKNAATQIAGDHGSNWGIINKFYGEFTNSVMTTPCHRLLVANAKDIREPNEVGKGGDTLETRGFYGKVTMQVEGQKGLRGECNTVLYAFQKPDGWAYTTVKERGPLGHPKRPYLLNENTTDKGFVPSYLLKVAGWRP